MTRAFQALHEPYAHLYVGDYFADTLDLSAHEHCALRLLLLETWVRGPVGNVRLASVAGLTKEEWQAIKPAVLPLLRGVQSRIVESLNYIRTFDGQRLPSAAWHIVRSIVMERDSYACIYCGSDKQLEADHILPLSHGGSNAFVNLATACRSCNLSKGSKAVEDWGFSFVRSRRKSNAQCARLLEGISQALASYLSRRSLSRIERIGKDPFPSDQSKDWQSPSSTNGR